MAGYFRAFLILSLIAFIPETALSQCTDGLQPECMCSTANVLCTINDLDGYTFSMDDFMHPQDAPQPLCSSDFFSQPHNPTWFAFQAWCEELTLDVIIDNCVEVGNSIGVQIAIYSDCTNFTEVDCNVSIFECNTDNKTLVMTDLEIGDTYYFLVDGCNGSYCDITVEIDGECGAELIENWTEPIVGNMNPCLDIPETYSVEDIVGANLFHWFVDGVEVSTTTVASNELTWDALGTFQLCVDASSEPCIPVTDQPMQICTTLTVIQSEAGEILVDPPLLCPRDTADLSASGYLTDVGFVETILVVDDAGTIVQVTPGDVATFTHPTCGQFTVYSYNFYDPDGTLLPSVGSLFSDIDCLVSCCDLEGEPLTFEDSEAPFFLTLPGPITVDCLADLPEIDSLEWSDNCDGIGLVEPEQDINANDCSGGTVTRIWSYTDQCGNEVDHEQIITIDPAVAPAFIDPPLDLIVSCDEIPASGPDLAYSNDELGNCLIDGMVSPQLFGDPSTCGGSFMFVWTVIDACGNPVTHVQNITITPPNPIEFIDPPEPLNVDCENIPTSAPDLMFTNNESGACQIEGSAVAETQGSVGICGGSFSFIWNATDVCDNVISHSQEVIVSEAPPAAFVNPPGDASIACVDVPATPPSLMYTNGLVGNCSISGEVQAVQMGEIQACDGMIQFIWSFTDECGRNIEHIQNLTIEPAPEAVFTTVPADIDVNCEDVASIPTTLDYSNSTAAPCDIIGTANAQISGDYSDCGGDLLYEWTFTDECGRTITEEQIITVLPAAEPQFIDPPESVLLPCETDFTENPELTFTNGLEGECEISGTLIAETVIDGNEAEHFWSFENPCSGVIISHFQIEIKSPEPELFIEEDVIEICLGQSIDLLVFQPEDLNETDPAFTFHTGSPASPANMLSSTVVSPTQTTEYVAAGVNTAGCMDEITMTVEVALPLIAGEDGFGTICNDLSSIDLFSYLSNSIDLTGSWIDPIGQNVNISNPFSVNFTGADVGTYEYWYILISSNICPNDTAVLILEVIEELDLEILSIECSADLSTYSVLIEPNGSNITSDMGDVMILPSEEVIVENIPINSDVLVSAVNPANMCMTDVLISPPNCDCPDIDPPINPGNLSICEGDAIPTLEVMVGAEQSANWYADPAGDVLLAGESITFTPGVSVPGTYTYYVETVSTIDTNCISLIKTEVQLEITTAPIANDVSYPLCDIDQDQSETFDLTVIIQDINPNPSVVVSFHETVEEAESQTNEVGLLYLLAGSNSHLLYASVVDVSGCQSIAEIELILQPIPEVAIDSVTTDCATGLGTIEFQALSDSYSYSIDNGPPFTMTMANGITQGPHTLSIVDTSGCSIDIPFEVEPVVTLTISVTEVKCDDQGTLGDALDDTFTFMLNVQGAGLSGWQTVDGTLSGSNGSNDLIGPFLITNGAWSQTFIDLEDGNCPVQFFVDAPSFCSEPCVPTITLIEISDCDNGGTGNEASDDIFSIIINVLPGAASTAEYNVAFGNENKGTFPYGQSITIDSLPANGSLLNLIVTDILALQCIDTVQVSQNHCSSCPDINVEAGDTAVLSCDALSVAIMGTSAEMGTYSWSGPNGFESNSQDTVVTFPGTYILTFTTPDQCEYFDSVEVVLDENTPFVNAGPDTSLTCIVDSIRLFAVVTGGGSSTYEWRDEGGNLIGSQEWIDVFVAGTFAVQVTNSMNGCMSPIDQVIVQDLAVELNPVIMTDPTSEFDCNIKETRVFTILEDNMIAIWQYPNMQIDTAEEIRVVEAGLVTVTVLDTITGCTGSSTLMIQDIEEYPLVVLQTTGSDLCGSTSAVIDAEGSTQGSTLEYLWFNADNEIIGENVETIAVSTAGRYVLQILDTANGCLNSDTILIEFFEPIGLQLLPSINLAEGDVIELTATVQTSLAAITSIKWSPGNQLSCDTCLITTLTAQTDALIQLEVIDTNGCVELALIEVNVVENRNVFFPNVITPGDISPGINDYFTIYGSPYLEQIISLEIFNRWGELLFRISEVQPNIPELGWDGTFKGNIVPPGVYVFKAEVRYADTRTEFLVGDITILR